MGHYTLLSGKDTSTCTVRCAICLEVIYRAKSSKPRDITINPWCSNKCYEEYFRRYVKLWVSALHWEGSEYSLAVARSIIRQGHYVTLDWIMSGHVDHITDAYLTHTVPSFKGRV